MSLVESEPARPVDTATALAEAEEAARLRREQEAAGGGPKGARSGAEPPPAGEPAPEGPGAAIAALAAERGRGGRRPPPPGAGRAAAVIAELLALRGVGDKAVADIVVAQLAVAGVDVDKLVRDIEAAQDRDRVSVAAETLAGQLRHVIEQVQRTAGASGAAVEVRLKEMESLAYVLIQTALAAQATLDHAERSGGASGRGCRTSSARRTGSSAPWAVRRRGSSRPRSRRASGWSTPGPSAAACGGGRSWAASPERWWACSCPCGLRWGGEAVMAKAEARERADRRVAGVLGSARERAGRARPGARSKALADAFEVPGPESPRMFQDVIDEYVEARWQDRLGLTRGFEHVRDVAGEGGWGEQVACVRHLYRETDRAITGDKAFEAGVRGEVEALCRKAGATEFDMALVRIDRVPAVVDVLHRHPDGSAYALPRFPPLPPGRGSFEAETWDSHLATLSADWARSRRGEAGARGAAEVDRAVRDGYLALRGRGVLRGRLALFGGAGPAAAARRGAAGRAGRGSSRGEFGARGGGSWSGRPFGRAGIRRRRRGAGR